MCQRDQRVKVRLYTGAQYALCGRQYSNAPDSKQRSFLCNSLGWQAGGLLCVTWPLLLVKFSKLMCFSLLFVRPLSKLLQASLVLWVRSHSWGTSFPHFVNSIQCHALSKEGPTSWVNAAYWICSFATWRRSPSPLFHDVSCLFQKHGSGACMPYHAVVGRWTSMLKICLNFCGKTGDVPFSFWCEAACKAGFWSVCECCPGEQPVEHWSWTWKWPHGECLCTNFDGGNQRSCDGLGPGSAASHKHSTKYWACQEVQGFSCNVLL